MSSRIELPTPQTMSPEQRAVHDKVVSGPRGQLRGPLRAALYNPELADRWQAFGALLRYGTTLPPRLSELAILVTGRHCNSPFEWYMHRLEGEKAGLEAALIEDLLAQRQPMFTAQDDALVYQFALELNQSKSVSDATYAQALTRFGARTLVELTALVGYYTLVAMTLNAHEIPMPDDVAPAFPLPQHQAVRGRAPPEGARTAARRADAKSTATTEHTGTLPQGWDCHAHVFGPYARYPAAPDAHYVPPPAVASDYLALLQRLGLAHGVLVQPSAYGADASLLLDVLAGQPSLRGVLVSRASGPLDLKSLHGRGVRALRFSARSGAGANFSGSASFADLLTLAPRMADAGLHAELWTDCRMLETLAGAIRKLPVPVVIDHMGGFDVQAGVADPGFGALLRLLATGKVWVKLCAYRNLPAPHDRQAGRVFHEALLAANPQRLVWGSDWPHLRVTPAPDAADLLDLLRQWSVDPAQQRQILVDNPAALYD